MNSEIREVFEKAPPRRIERRRGPDKKGKLALWLSVLGWAFWAVGLFMTSFAYPQTVTYFDTLYGKSPRTTWQPEFLYVSEGIWAAGIVVCALSLALLHSRNKRRTDKPHYGILGALAFNALTLAGFGIFIFVSGF